MAFGAIVGSFIGDACGAFNQFNEELATDEELEECMKLNGGGPFNVGPG